MEQLSLFDSLREEYDWKKKSKLSVFEFFAGVGSQRKAFDICKNAFERKGLKVEHKGICEWAYNSILSYNAIHIKDFKDYSKDKTKEEMINRIRGISTDYNNPLTDEQLNKKPIEWIKSAYNNIIATNNLVDIQRVKGSDIEIKDDEDAIWTYSFPCQDLSLSGKLEGIKEGTRSGLLLEFERILKERYSLSLFASSFNFREC